MSAHACACLCACMFACIYCCLRLPVHNDGCVNVICFAIDEIFGVRFAWRLHEIARWMPTSLARNVEQLLVELFLNIRWRMKNNNTRFVIYKHTNLYKIK